MEEDKICYPYAYGRLAASLDYLASNLEMDCITKDIEVSEIVIELLKEKIKKIKEVAREESYSMH